MTREQAIQNQWSVANHRLAYSRNLFEKTGKGGQCNCADCKEHFAALESQEVGA